MVPFFTLVTVLAAQVQLLVIGDQNVRRWNDDDGRGLFENFFVGPFGSIAAGIPGDTALNLLWRVQNGELANFKPRVTVRDLLPLSSCANCLLCLEMPKVGLVLMWHVLVSVGHHGWHKRPYSVLFTIGHGQN